MMTFIDDISHRRAACQANYRKTLALMAAGAFIVMMAGTYWDIHVTATLIRNSLPSFNAFMGRTLFEGNLPGANDMVSILLLLTAAIYTYGNMRPNSQSRLASWRPQAGFVLTSGLVIGLFMVHGLKYLVGRARPSLVINEAWPYSLWFVFGPHAITDGNFNASFPSGHTAQAFVLMSVAYALAGDPLATKKNKILGWILGAIAFLFTAAMGIARCASENHWLTDVLGSICLGWPLMHWIYFGLLKVPAQRTYWAKHRHPPLLPHAWELVLSIGILLMGAGIITVINSIRGILANGPLWFGWLIPAGTISGWVGLKLFRRCNQITDTTLSGCDQQP